ncbi:VOC family protein [Devosia sp.]|jgi:predicted enzyme related to lactoylglutathione lyase|uniref:VOC family protein n=1 Tax=Devosia sp. TaxID=1871048 RepID=UPI00292FC466|nr:VOC family protein [Devosia sp.]
MGHPQRKPHQINGFGHFDIAGPELAPLRHFYTSLFGWEVAPQGPGYAMVATPDGSPNGAIVETPSPSMTFGVVVADLDSALDLAVREGGSVVLPKTDNGWVKKAQIADPAGNVLTLIQA